MMIKAKAAAKPKAAPKRKTVNQTRLTTSKPTKAKSRKPETSEPKESATPKSYYCSFCRKSSDTRRRLIAGPNNIFICDECIDVCIRILAEDEPLDWRNNLIKILASIDKKNPSPPKKEVKK